MMGNVTCTMWTKLRFMLCERITWDNRDEKENDPESYWLYTVIKMMDNIEYGDAE